MTCVVDARDGGETIEVRAEGDALGPHTGYVRDVATTRDGANGVELRVQLRAEVDARRRRDVDGGVGARDAAVVHGRYTASVRARGWR